MAATFAIEDVTPIPGPFPTGGIGKERIVEITTSGTYSVGGDTLTAAQLGFSKILFFHAELSLVATDAAWVPLYDYANSKLMFFGGATATEALDEADAGDDVEGNSFRARIIGI